MHMARPMRLPLAVSDRQLLIAMASSLVLTGMKSATRHLQQDYLLIAFARPHTTKEEYLMNRES